MSNSRIGLGCMGMSEFYGENNDDANVQALQFAYEIGYRNFDTADMYGRGHNEQLIGRFIKDLGESRKDIAVATKVGIVRDVDGPGTIGVDGSPEYILSACERSLERLNVDYIDLYYLHRRNPDVPIDETMSAMKQLLDQGLIKSVGLSEVSAETLKEANSVVSISALQSEYSLWSRDIENNILPQCKKLDVNLVAYSPLGRGFLSGKISKEQVQDKSDLRSMLPRFQGDSFDKNAVLLDAIEAIADAHSCSMAQVALAWVLAQEPLIRIIPGGRKTRNIEENFNSVSVQLTADEVTDLSNVFNPEKITGLRYPEALLHTVNT